MDKLPPEIIKLEILPRVPAKSLFRFKCVCKDWLSFLSTKGFEKRHLLESRKHQKLVFLDPQSRAHTLDCEDRNHQTTIRSNDCIPFKAAAAHDPHNMSFSGSLDGLICVRIDNTRTLMLWNPLTGAYKLLSKLYDDFVEVRLGPIGFYVDASNDYKLLDVDRTYDNNGAPCIRAYMYSLRSDRWRRIEFLENAQRIFDYDMHKYAVFSNNSLYFTACQDWDAGERMVICFDVKSETFREIQFPRNVPSDKSDFDWCLVNVNDCIHLYYRYRFGRDPTLNLYVNSEMGLWRLMEEESSDDHQWKKVASFNDIHIDAPVLWFDWYPLYIMNNKNYVDWIVIGFGDNDQPYIYRIDFKTKDIVDLYMSGISSIVVGTVRYIESFVSPNP